MSKETGQEQGKQMRFSDAEISLIKNTFRGNEDLLKLLRKCFLPEIQPDAPIGQVIDLWMTIPVEQLTPEQAIVNLKARNSLIAHVDQQLMQLKLMSELPEETAEEVLKRLKTNSNK